ncbi:DUF3592 domain-containing protein [Bittarella massiliensis]|uniref:DUF3592 domain-containing protein n=1 Tax=Bittarella massiliensis (ex Durand et al. 2017) TaxID=1720313 RepID=UPI00163CF00C|nr:DUF3592 domain-containing protein [Bittarella massiliensis (ex Durand et al. 2017)]
MRKRGYLLVRAIPILFTALFLARAIIKAQNVSSRLMILPFLICSVTELLRTMFLAAGWEKAAKLLNKVYAVSFLLYVFGFLGVWCYVNIANQAYLPLLFSLPFWLVGAYLVYRVFFRKKDQPVKADSKRRSIHLNVNFKVVVTCFLVGVCLLSGIVILFLGVKDTIQLSQRAGGYTATEGHFVDYEVYRSDREGTTYRLIYEYEVNGAPYRVSTDYGTNAIPARNSTRTVKYDPANPQKSVLAGSNSANWMVFMGLFFVLGSTVFILAWLTGKGCFDRCKVSVLGVYIGIVFTFVGAGSILLRMGETGSWLSCFQSFGLWILVPLLMIAAGVFQTVKCLLPARNKKGERGQ